MAISKLEEFSIRVIASWIKLLVIMHADKIGVKKKIFLDESSSFDLSLLFFEIHIKVTSSQTIKRYTPKSKSKMDTKNHEKSHFKLTIGHFCFQNTRQSKDYIEWCVLGL